MSLLNVISKKTVFITKKTKLKFTLEELFLTAKNVCCGTV